MRNFRALFVGAGLIWLLSQPVFAGSSTITTKDAGGVTQTFVVTTNAGGNFVGQQVICDATAAANCAAVSASNALKVDGSAATQPVSGTVTANLGTLNGAATETTAAATLAAIQGPVPTNPKTTTQAKLTVAVTNTYQQALASSAGRTGCTIQYIAVAGTKGFVFFGSAPADTTTSFQLTNGQSLNCAIGGVAVAQDAIQVTGTGTDIFIVSNQ